MNPTLPCERTSYTSTPLPYQFATYNNRADFASTPFANQLERRAETCPASKIVVAPTPWARNESSAPEVAGIPPPAERIVAEQPPRARVPTQAAERAKSPSRLRTRESSDVGGEPSAERTPREGAKTMGHCLLLAPRSASALETPFVGHSALFEELRELLVRTEGSAGRPSVILGNAGHGKSRLLRELSALWPQTASVISLRCEPDAPFGRTSLADQLRFALDAGGPRRDATESTETLEPRLRAVAARRPLLCLVDDLHLAASDELDLFEALSNECRHARLALVATCSSEPRTSTTVALRLRGWVRSGTQTFTLPPLDRSASELLLRNALAARRRTLDTVAKEAMLEVASGNPRYITELVDELNENDSAPTLIRVPLSAREKLVELRHLVAKPAFALLRTLSVFGHPFEHDWIAHLITQQSSETTA